ncbi:ras and EF-hand domain-containing protein homolog isoform X2 [Apostichopus japonicus]|uniref:ras and EF-hand domain-containing protein homolog isoform X2 n=1 Tax=Stichopus japonicus TaxID=307972 RepID=UPI003AB82D95
MGSYKPIHINTNRVLILFNIQHNLIEISSVTWVDFVMMTSQSPSPESIRNLFEACDLDNNGYIERTELASVCGELNADELHNVFVALDRDEDGRISLDDFSDGFQSVSDTLLAVSIRRKRQQQKENGHQSETIESFLGKLDQSFDLISVKCQESICDLYQELHKSDAPHLLNQYEKVIFEVIKDIKQQQAEVHRLEKSLKRTSESHSSHLNQLESEAEAQAAKIEARIRLQERERREQETAEIKRQLNNEIHELENNLKKYQTVEARLQTRDKPRDDLMQTLRKEVDELRQENRQLKSAYTELQTSLALAKSENLELKSEYDDQMGFITSNRDTLQEYIQEHENLTRQLEMLHEANKKLQDTNDDLRAALENLQKNTRVTPHSNRLAMSRSSSMQSYDSRQTDSSLRRRQFSYQASMDSNDISDLHNRNHGNYMMSRYNDVDSIPDDVDFPLAPPAINDEFFDSGNSTLRDPNEVLDLEAEEEARRPPPISEEVVTIDGQGNILQHQRNGESMLSNGDITLPRSPKPSPTTIDKSFERNSSARSSRSSTKSGRKRALPQIPVKPVAPKIPQGTPERMYKIVLAGDAAVGKSSFILRLCKGIFHNNLNSTLGVDFQVRTMDIDGRITSVQLWDTAGQERFRSIAKSYFRRADGVLLLYDCTFERSFINVRDWIEAVEDGAQKTVPIMICANKVDRRAAAVAEGVRCVRTEDGERLASSFDALFIETSAKDNCNVEEAVIELVRTLHKNEDMEVGNGAVTLSTEEITKQDKAGLSCCN